MGSATLNGRGGKVPSPVDAITVEEALAAQLGKLPRRDRLERDDGAYRWCVRRALAEGSPFRTTHREAAVGCGYDAQLGERGRMHTSVKRALNALQELGLIRWGGVKRPDGRWHCLEIEVLEPPEHYRELRRAITHRKATHRRRSHARNGGHKPVRRRLRRCQVDRRYRPPAATRRIFFAGEVTYPLRGSPPKGGSPGGGPMRAREGPSPPGAGEDRSQRDQLIETFEHTLSRPARFSHRRWGAALDRALRRLDRYADFGRGQHGAGLALAADLLEAQADEERVGEPRWGSLAYLVPILDEASKAWRRAHKPRLRAERRKRANQRGRQPAPPSIQQEESSHG
jgi:hypothetical protein